MLTCCDDPRPEVLEKNGRLFCKNCRRYLDILPAEPEPQADEGDEESPSEQE